MAVVKWLTNLFDAKKRNTNERRQFKEIDDQLVFAASKHLTLGVEFELGLLDHKTLLPANVGPDIVGTLASPYIKEEGLQHMVEVTSAIGETVGETESQIMQEIAKLSQACEKRELLLTGTGRPPTIKQADTVSTQNERYFRLTEERQILRTRFGALGMHIHLGMKDAEECVRYNNFFMHFLPHLIALSASSPFEEGVFTGLASMRPTVAESMPISGSPYYFQDWQGYVQLCRALFRAGSIHKLKDLWWDLRPSPNYGTLEIRVCDQPSTITEGMAIVAFVHLLAHWFDEHQSWIDEMPRPNVWRSRENKWRTMRYGLDARLVMNNQGDTTPLCDDIKSWASRVENITKKLGYEPHMKMLENILERGNSAKRQQRLWEATQSLEEVARFNCAEFAAQTPLWEKLEAITNALGPKTAAG